MITTLLSRSSKGEQRGRARRRRPPPLFAFAYAYVCIINSSNFKFQFMKKNLAPPPWQNPLYAPDQRAIYDSNYVAWGEVGTYQSTYQNMNNFLYLLVGTWGQTINLHKENQTIKTKSSPNFWNQEVKAFPGIGNEFLKTNNFVRSGHICTTFW